MVSNPSGKEAAALGLRTKYNSKQLYDQLAYAFFFFFFFFYNANTSFQDECYYCTKPSRDIPGARGLSLAREGHYPRSDPIPVGLMFGTSASVSSAITIIFHSWKSLACSADGEACSAGYSRLGYSGGCDS